MSYHLRNLKSQSMTFCIDFDGTCVSHAYPGMGHDIGAVPVLRKIVDHGHKIVLFTMRDKNELRDAVNWFHRKNIPLYGVNVNPDQQGWTTSPKAWGKIYIDDCGFGIPLVDDGVSRPYVDWKAIDEELSKRL